MSLQHESKNFCKKCLIKDMPQDAYFKNLYEYIEHLDENIKTENIEYQRRLDICKECDNLLSGMCRLCGCFVELRAVINNKSCPDAKRKW